VYNDENLTKDLQSGKKIHAIYGSVMLELEYEVVKANKGLYNDSKRAFLGRLYGAQDPKVSKVLNRPLEQIVRNEKKLAGRYPGIGRARQETADRFCSMRQEGGVGSRIEWREPAEYEESLFGYKRWFTLENRIARVLFELGQSPPHDLRDQTVVERTAGRRQGAGGAAQSALFAAAFGIQASAMRQAANHRIQSTGAWITKELQRALWDLQPVGINVWRVRPMQIHDEIQCPRLEELDLGPTVAGVVERFRERIPLIRMDWMRGLKSWAEKG
jgi:DNA polymerase I-like protein with 3'-5' exonuclease and polymerase domains